MKLRFPHISVRKKKDIVPREKPIVYERPLRFAEIQDKKKKRGRLIKSVLILGILLLFISGAVFLRSFFTVKRVVCVVEGQACDGTLMETAHSLVGKSMFRNLMLSHAYLVVKTARMWPNGVRVQFFKPELLVTFTSSREGMAPFSLTKTGVVVGFTGENPHLPPIRDLQLETKQVGDHANETTFLFYQSLVSLLPKMNIMQITGITVSDDETVTLYLDENSLAVAEKKRIEDELQSLQTLLLSPALDRKGKTIDLRFENPVVR